MTRGPARNSFWVLAAILALGFALRVTGLAFGLPHVYHADEPIVVHHALAYGTGDLNPHFFKIPPLTSYLLFLVYGASYLLMHAVGVFQSPDDFLEAFLRDPSLFYLAGRFAVGVLPGIVSLMLTYRLGRRLGLTVGASGAAFFLSVSFLHVRNCHYIYPDPLFVLALLVSLLAVLNVLEKGRTRDYMWAGLWVGIAAGAKYYGALVSPVLFFAHVLRMKREGKTVHLMLMSPNLACAAASSLAAFLATTPYTILDAPFFLKELASQAASEAPVGWLHHVRYSLREGVGLPMAMAAGAGMALSILKRETRLVLLALYAVVFFSVLAFFSQQHDRYVLPLVPAAVLFAGRFMDVFRSKRLLAIAVAAGLAWPTLLKDYHVLRLFLSGDVRTQAKQWMEAHIPAGSGVALEEAFFQPRLSLSREAMDTRLAEARSGGFTRAQVMRLEKLQALSREPGWTGYRLFYLASRASPTFLLSKPTVPYDVGDLKALGVSHVLLCRLEPTHPQRDFLKTLQAHGSLVRTFTPYRDPELYSLERFPRTGAPTRLEELRARNALGERIELYALGK